MIESGYDLDTLFLLGYMILCPSLDYTLQDQSKALNVSEIGLH